MPHICLLLVLSALSELAQLQYVSHLRFISMAESNHEQIGSMFDDNEAVITDGEAVLTDDELETIFLIS